MHNSSFTKLSRFPTPKHTQYMQVRPVPMEEIFKPDIKAKQRYQEPKILKHLQKVSPTPYKFENQHAKKARDFHVQHAWQIA